MQHALAQRDLLRVARQFSCHRCYHSDLGAIEQL